MTHNQKKLTLAVLAILVIQIIYMNNVYCDFIKTNTNIINRAVRQAINLEYLVQSEQSFNKNTNQYTPNIAVNDMSQSMLDSLLKIAPLPTNLPETPNIKKYDLQQLIDGGVIEHSSEIEFHTMQDIRFENNEPINVNLLDSLIDETIGEVYKKRIEITNDNDSLIASLGTSDIDYNYQSQRIQIGFKGYQYITVWAEIPISSLLMQSIGLLIISILILSIPIYVLFAQLKSIELKNQQLKERENTVIGIIHDLKSPLSRVISSLSIDKRFEEDLEKKQTINTNILTLRLLVSNIEMLLNTRSNHNQGIAVSKRPIALVKLVEQISSMANLIKDGAVKPCEIAIKNDSAEGNKILEMDMLLFDSILSNLIENAIKYSYDEVKIDIDISLDANDKLCLKVKDNGIGIDPAHHKDVFKQYYRVANNNAKGHGIGLTYIQDAVLACGGDITLESAPEKGSTFTITL